MYEIFFNIWPSIKLELISYEIINYVIMTIIFMLIITGSFSFVKIIEILAKKLSTIYLKYKLIKQIKKDKTKELLSKEGIELIKNYIKLLEYNTKKQYTSIDDILIKNGFSNNEIQEIINIIYKQHSTNKSIEEKIKNSLIKFT